MLKNTNYFLFFFKIPSISPSELDLIFTNLTKTCFSSFFFKPRKFKFKKFLKTFIRLSRLFSKVKSSSIYSTYSRSKLIRVSRRSFFRKNKKYLRSSRLFTKNINALLTNQRYRRFLRFNIRSIYPTTVIEPKKSYVSFYTKKLWTFLKFRQVCKIPSYELFSTYNNPPASSRSQLFKSSIGSLLKPPSLKFLYKNQAVSNKIQSIKYSDHPTVIKTKDLYSSSIRSYTKLKRYAYNAKISRSAKIIKRRLISLKRRLRFFKFKYKKRSELKLFFLKNKKIFQGQSQFNVLQYRITSLVLANYYCQRSYN